MPCNIAFAQNPVTYPKSKQQISSEEEEEEYEEEEEEEFEEEEDEDEGIDKRSKCKTEAQKTHTNEGKPKKAVESNKEEKTLPKERRAQKEVYCAVVIETSLCLCQQTFESCCPETGFRQQTYLYLSDKVEIVIVWIYRQWIVVLL